MSARFVDYWESYGTPHDDKTKEYLDTDDLMVKAKYNFLGKKLKLSAKTKFNSEGGLKASSDYTLTHNVSPLTSYMLIHRPSNITLDGNFKLCAKDQTYVSLYTNMVLTQTATKRALSSKLHVRMHHDNNKIFSVGLENIDLLKCCQRPDVISTWGVYGYNLESQAVKLIAGPYLGFQLSTKALLFQRYLVGFKQANFTSFLECGINRVVSRSVTEENVEVENVSYAKNVNCRFDAKVNKSLKVIGDLGYNFDSSNVDARLVGEYAIDDATTVKARIQNDNTLTVGLLHNYRNLINFGFVTRFDRVCGVKPKEGETATSLCHMKCKFGLTVELNDTLI